jgi:hypothetical protein
MEQAWNNLGYSLRNPDDINKLKGAAPDFEKILQQAEYLSRTIRDIDEKVMTARRNLEQEAKDFEDKVKASAEAKYNELYNKVKEKYPEEVSFVENAKEDPNILQKPNKDLSNFVHKEWNLEKGDAGSFLVKGSAQLDLSGSLKKLEGLTDARVDVAAMNTVKANLVYLYGKTTLDDQGMGQVKTGVEVLGNVVDFLTVDKKGKVLDIRLSDNKKKDAENSNKGPWKKEVRAGQDFPFSIGPVPVVVEVGVLGQLYLDTGMSVDAVQRAAGLSLYPGVSASAYASFAAGVPVAKVGIEGQMVLLNSEMALTGRLMLQTNTDSGKKKIVLNVRGDHTSTSLSGRMALFAEAKLPVIGKKRYERKLWESDGQAVSGVLFDFTKAADENGIVITGAPQPEDLQEVAVDNELQKFFDEANRKMSEAGLKETLQRMAVLESETSALGDAAKALAQD